MTRALALLAAASCLAAAWLPRPVRAQPLAARVASAGDGRVQMRFAARPGVCGDGRGMIGTGRSSVMQLEGSYSTGDDDWHQRCLPGPVRVVLTTRGGTVQRARVYVGGSDSAADVHDLGTVTTRDATDYLLSLARQGERHVGETCVIAAVLADSVTVWPALLDIARDSTRSRAPRESATFWLSRIAAAAVNRTTLFADDEGPESDEEDVRGQAIFALSQQPHHEGIEPLIQVVRTNKDPAMRSKALFWLGQSRDPRALTLFAEILQAN